MEEEIFLAFLSAPCLSWLGDSNLKWSDSVFDYIVSTESQ